MRNESYTIFIEVAGSYRISDKAYYLRRWHGPISSEGRQCVMCYDKATLYSLLKFCKDTKVKVFKRRATGLHTYDYLELMPEELDEVLESIYTHSRGFKKKYEKAVDVGQLTKYHMGKKPHYASQTGTGNGTAYCPECRSCVCDMHIENGQLIGWFKQVCKCGVHIDWSQAEEFL